MVAWQAGLMRETGAHDRPQRTVFGEVAEVYDRIRPGYPDELVAAVLDYAGAPGWAVEVGAGTGKGTEAFVRAGVAVRCVEADDRMAAVLRQRFTGGGDGGVSDGGVSVEVSRFEQWRAPDGGVPLLLCAQAWHWMDPLRRCALAHAALAPGGAVALFGHEYRFVDPVVEAAVTGVYAAHAPQLLDVDHGGAVVPDEHWLVVELAGCGLFTDVRSQLFPRVVDYPTAGYVRLAQTYSPFRRLVPTQHRPVVLAALAEALDAAGGVVGIRLETVLAVGRRPG